LLATSLKGVYIGVSVSDRFPVRTSRSQAKMATISIEFVHKRVDNALKLNRRAERIVIGMAVGMFLLGLAIVVTGYWSQNLYVTGGAAVLQGFLYWPIKEILKLRRDNIVLQVTPIVVERLSPEAAANEIREFLIFLRK
jgi:hypothetical protein